jgi:hypothetical protein
VVASVYVVVGAVAAAVEVEAGQVDFSNLAIVDIAGFLEASVILPKSPRRSFVQPTMSPAIRSPKFQCTSSKYITPYLEPLKQLFPPNSTFWRQS